MNSKEIYSGGMYPEYHDTWGRVIYFEGARRDRATGLASVRGRRGSGSTFDRIGWETITVQKEVNGVSN
jgi:hypothetical protein